MRQRVGVWPLWACVRKVSISPIADRELAARVIGWVTREDTARGRK